MHTEYTPRIQARFWAKVDRDGPIPAHRPELGPCWPWTGSTDPQGYGQFVVYDRERRGPRMLRAHRVAYELGRGPIPDGLGALHACDYRPCANYERHLFLGTPLDNSRDAIAKGRTARGERCGSAKLTEHQVAEIRIRLAAGATCAGLGREYGVGEMAIAAIRDGRTWGWL